MSEVKQTEKEIAAEMLYSALMKLLTGLAKDGVAIEGFTDGWKAVQEYNRAKFDEAFNDLLPTAPKQD